VSRPYAIRTDAGLVGLAGLWERSPGPDGRPRETFAVLTTDANERLAAVHDRMPVILERRQFGLWLDPERRDRGALGDLLVPYPADRTRIEPVSTRVNKSDFDDPSCLAPPEADGPQQKSLF
jgi:putative SOS response-associated peptidase YedK